jgi:hypothetical protein
MLFLLLSVDPCPGDLWSAQEEQDRQLELCLHKLCDTRIHMLLEGKTQRWIKIHFNNNKIHGHICMHRAVGGMLIFTSF